MILPTGVEPETHLGTQNDHFIDRGRAREASRMIWASDLQMSALEHPSETLVFSFEITSKRTLGAPNEAWELQM